METMYPNAHELPNSTMRPSGKSVGRTKTSGNGTKQKSTAPPVSAAAKARDREITEANQTIMIVSPTGHRRIVRLADYRAGLVS